MSDYHHLLVGVANAETDVHVMEVAKRFLHNDVILDIVNIIDLPDELLNMNGEAGPIDNENNVNNHHMQKSETYLNHLVDQCGLSGNKNVRCHIKVGNPRSLLSHTLPEEFHSELIIIGRRRHFSLEDVLLGSTTKHVAAKAICDTLIVDPKN